MFESFSFFATIAARDVNEISDADLNALRTALYVRSCGAVCDAESNAAFALYERFDAAQFARASQISVDAS